MDSFITYSFWVRVSLKYGNNNTMTKEAKKILADAMILPEKDRALLAASLIDSLDEATDPDVDDAWEAEIQRRAQEISSGKVKGISWADARKALLESIE